MFSENHFFPYKIYFMLKLIFKRNKITLNWIFEVVCDFGWGDFGWGGHLQVVKITFKSVTKH